MVQETLPQHADTPWRRRLTQEVRPRRLVPTLTAGLVAGLLGIIVQSSYAGLIFSGPLAGDVSRGIGLTLFGAVVMRIVVAWRSSFPATVADPQDIPAAILALVAADIVRQMPAAATSAEIFVTVVAAIAATSLGTGTFFLALGLLKLGNLVRFVPYPVIGGFLAGTGWLLVQGALSFMADASLSALDPSYLLRGEVLIKWLPGLLFAVLLLVVIRRYEHFLLMPAMVLAAMGLFYLLVLLTNSSMAAISAQGWVLGPFPQAGLWPPLTASALAHVHWSVLFGQIGHGGTLLVISGIAALLNTSGLEVTTRRPLEVNRELQAVGLGNLLAGLGGAPVGYHVLSDTALMHKMGVDSRGVGVCAAALCGTALFFGPSLLSYFPKPMLGGLLLFLGFTFLVEWVYEAWFKLTRRDYGLVLMILTVIATCGLLEGVAVGVGVAVVLFVADYSRIGIVSQTHSGVTYQSTVERPLQQRRVLREQGEQLYILKLQGYIFFGTANHVLQRVRQRAQAADLPSLRFVVLDFHRVSGLDASALHSFATMKEVAETQALTLVFTHLAPKLRQQLAEGGYDQEDDQVFRTFPDLDHGVEWCENHLLGAAQGLPTEQQRTLQEQLRDVFPTAGHVARFMTYLDKQEVKAGFQLIRQGAPPQGLYFLDAGQLTAQLEGEAGERVRLRTMGAGTVVGELGLYLGCPASASVVTERPSTLYHLSLDAFTQLEQTDPEVATALHKFMVRLVGARLANNNKTLQALLD